MNSNLRQMYFGSLALDRDRPRNVVYYGRVSTQHEAQLDALENQMQWYEDQSKYHPNWTVLNRYIDEGITGTSAKKRPSFMEMIEDAKKQKFDLIVTREVCRFARNTVDTLVLTRELKKYGVEVYFVEDNIWTMDGDGELRLSLMATLAQEESRKISERVRAGQKVSRENGVLYGNGNILGYDRVGSTYVINPEQAETVRMIFDLYSEGKGLMEVCKELTRLGRLNAVGEPKWYCPQISRILRNATYMGYIVYNKSITNNYLEKQRINNLDETSYIYKKGDFEPIITEEQWTYCKNIREQRSRTCKTKSGEQRKIGTSAPKLLWVKKLRCRCGSNYSRYKWRVLKDGTPIYGYSCNYRRSSMKKEFLENNGIVDIRTCDSINISEWKLYLMATLIFSQVWGTQKDSILRALEMLENVTRIKSLKPQTQNAEISFKIDKIEKRILNFGNMRADGELSKEQYIVLCAQAEKEKEELEQLLITAPEKKENLNLKLIKEKLNQFIDISTPQVSDELIDEFVECVTQVEDYYYRWKLNLTTSNNGSNKCNLMQPTSEPILAFTIDYETAKIFREKNHLPLQQFRRCAWNDIDVEVYM